MIITSDNLKSNLRKSALEQRRSLANTDAIKNISAKIIQNILNSNDFKSAYNIALYYPIKGEISLLPLLNIKDKNFFFPRCSGLELEFCRYDNFSDFTSGKFGIYEPNGDKINPEILDLIYVPALLASSEGYRIGYGKGYYDRFFAKHNLKSKKLIVIASQFISKNLIHDKFDIKCDGIICENTIC